MTTSATGIGLAGIDGVRVEVQVARQDGLPGIDITGLPTASIREARHRVRSAFRAAAYPWPEKRLLANFAPADLPKAGTAYDLPLAVALLALDAVVPRAALAGTAFFGELGLGGEVRPVPGAINAALATRAAGLRRLVVARAAAGEAAAVPGVEVVGVGSLVELVEGLGGRAALAVASPAPDPGPPRPSVDLAAVRGQHRARRALEVAAAGGHNLLMVGPPGCGKTLLARALAGILPPLSLDEQVEVTRIHSVSGLTRGEGLVRARPFRAPHATASDAALVGGGNPPRPGEVSLAHHGVLFLDETPEFRRTALEALRAPLEDRTVAISRAGRRVVFPSSFALVCALNPCPCGHKGDRTRACRCSDQQVARYRRRMSGPLLDRIDLHVELAPVPPEVLAEAPDGEASEAVRGRVVAARARQVARNAVGGRALANAELGPEALRLLAPLAPAERGHLARAARALGLTARSWDRVIRVARTVADLAGSEDVRREHLSEALTYRLVDRDAGRGREAAEGWDGAAP